MADIRPRRAVLLRVLCEGVEQAPAGRFLKLRMAGTLELPKHRYDVAGIDRSGGARPKIVAWVSEGKTKIIHGGTEMPEGYSPWMIKFSEAQDGRNSGVIEYLYSVIAKRAGIEMPETHLFASAACPGYFGVKRFDRIGTRKIPVHTACGLLHASTGTAAWITRTCCGSRWC